MEIDSGAMAAALDALTSDVLIHFLTGQRWYAIKGAVGARGRVIDWVVAPWGGGRYAFARIGVVTDNTTEHVYQLPVAVLAEATATPETAVITYIDVDGTRLAVVDAVHDHGFRLGLANAVTAGNTADRDGARWTTEPIGTKRLLLAADTPTRLGSAEQSNTSIVVGDVAIIKLFRLLKPGVHPDVEVTDFLTTHTAFPNTPALLGVITFASRDGRTTLGMAQDFLTQSTDAWSYALEQGAPYFAA
ncbi:MAG: hypothetical protein ABI205_12020, partial [Gemmatimonadaceae bacterium]